MTTIYTLNLIFITQYIYQLQNRLYTFEKKNKYKMTEKIESILLDSWGATNSYLSNKKIKKNNINFQYLNVLKNTTDASTYLLDKNINVETDEFKSVAFITYDRKVHHTRINKTVIYIKCIQYLLLKQLFLQIKIKEGNTYLLDKEFNLDNSNNFSFNKNAAHFDYDVKVKTYDCNAKNSTAYHSNTNSNYNKVVGNKFLSTKKSRYLFYKSKFFLIQFRLIKSLLIGLVIYNNKEQLSYSIMKNYLKITYLNLQELETQLNKKFTFKGLNKMGKAAIVTTVTKKHRFLNRSIFFVDNTKKLLYLNNMNTIINLNKPYLVNFDKLFICSIQNFRYPEQILKIKSKFALTNTIMRINLSKKLGIDKLNDLGSWLPKRTVVLMLIRKGIHCFLAANKLTFTSATTSTACCTNFFLLEKLVSTANHRSIQFRLYSFKNLYKFYYFCFKSKKINKACNLTHLNIKFTEKKILCSLDNKLFILKLTDLLIYLLLLKPRWVNNLNEHTDGPNNNNNNTYSTRQGAINFVIKNLKVKSQYFVHFIIQDSYNYLHFNCLKLKKLTLNSNLFEYLLKKLNNVNSKKINTLLSSNWERKLGGPGIDKKTHILKKLNFSTYYLKKKRTILSLATKKKIKNLFFNILFTEISLKLKNYILIKNAKKIFLCFKVNDIRNNICNLFRTNLAFKPTNFHFNSLPNCIWYKNQILILKKHSNSIYECLTVLKKILYLYGLGSELSQIKIGHTLLCYNKNSPGLDFLGFFICQYNYQTNINLQLNNTFLFYPNQKLYTSTYLSSTKINTLGTQSQATVFLNHNLIFVESQIKTLTTLERENQVDKLSNKFVITTLQPSKTEIRFYVEKLKKIIKTSNAVNQESLIVKLSNNIRIWAYYYKIIFNKKILQYCDYLLFKMLWRWSCRRHPNKNKKWIKYKYFHKMNGNTWVFGVYKTTTSHLICLPNHRDIK